MSPLPIIQAPQGPGGSGRGMSFFEKAASYCPRKARLDEEQRQEFLDRLKAGEVQYKPSGSKAMDTGTCFHLLCEYFYKGEITNAAVQISDLEWETPFQIARQLFNLFLNRFPDIDFWGDVMGIEEELESPDPMGTFGVSRYTGTPDLVTEISEAQAKRIEACTGNSVDQGEKLILHPGRYLLDWKTTGKARPPLMYNLRQQFQSYCLLYEEVHGITPHGMIVVEPFVSTARDPNHKIRTYFVPYPDETEVEGLLNYMQAGEKLMELDWPLGRGHGCHTYNKPCSHLIEGRCDRT